MNFKWIILAACLVFSTYSFSQIETQKKEEDKAILGSEKGDWRIGLSVNTYDWLSATPDEVGLDVEYFFRDKWSVNGRLSGSSQGHKVNAGYLYRSWRLGLETGLKYYFLKSKRWNAWTHLNLGYSFGESQYLDDSNSMVTNRGSNIDLNLGFGAEYKFNDKWSLGMSFNVLGATYYSGRGRASYSFNEGSELMMQLSVKYKF